MKQEVHPQYYKVQAKCVCGNIVETGSVLENIKLEICNKCHPLFTGQQKIVDTEGRIERFNRKFNKKEA